MRNLVLLLIAASAAPAATYYVAARGGSNSNRGSISAPFATINRGIQAANAGDTVYVRGGTYHALVYVGPSDGGASGRPVVISGYPGETAIVDGQGALPGGSFPAHLYDPLFLVEASYVTVQDITVQNSTGMGLRSDGSYNLIQRVNSYGNGENGILLSTGSYNIVQDSVLYNNCKWHVNGQRTPDGYFASGLSSARGGAHHNIIRRNTVSLTWGEGISLFESTHNTVEDNVAYDNWQNFYISDTTNNLVQRNLAYCTAGNPIESLNEQHGFMLDDEHSNPPSAYNTVINNLAYGCTGAIAVGTKQMNNVLIANNTFAQANVTNRAAATFIVWSNGAAVNSRIENNVIYQGDSKPISSGSGNGITWANNVWSKTPGQGFLGTGSVVADPLLAKAGPVGQGTLTHAWFALQTRSPAIGAALSLPGIVEDYLKASRDAHPDAGGLEYAAPSPVSPKLAPGLDRERNNRKKNQNQQPIRAYPEQR
jgi:parallel beta-helix repeat protein